MDNYHKIVFHKLEILKILQQVCHIVMLLQEMIIMKKY